MRETLARFPALDDHGVAVLKTKAAGPEPDRRLSDLGDLVRSPDTAMRLAAQQRGMTMPRHAAQENRQGSAMPAENTPEQAA